MKEDLSPYSESQIQTALIARVMSHPARIAILQYIINNGGCCFTNIRDVLPLAKATTSQHIKELVNSGLIVSDGNETRPKYCINKEITAQAKELFAKVLDCVCSNNK